MQKFAAVASTPTNLFLRKNETIFSLHLARAGLESRPFRPAFFANHTRRTHAHRQTQIEEQAGGGADGRRD